MGKEIVWTDESTGQQMPMGEDNYAPENRNVILAHEFANKVQMRANCGIKLLDDKGAPIPDQAISKENLKAAIRAALDNDEIYFEGDKAIDKA